MKLRHVDQYQIGLDIGTASVGWAAVDMQGNLLRFKGKPTWGSRLFDSAETAEQTRAYRGLRRRYQRRRQRLNLLQGIFADAMQDCDPEFFVRLNQSRLHAQDRNSQYFTDYKWPLFSQLEFEGRLISEPEYYKEFPTIYHLRAYLCSSDKKADIRLIYLALHHIVKHRGNFLYQDQPALRAGDVSTKEALEDLSIALSQYFEEEGIEVSVDITKAQKAIEDSYSSKTDRYKSLCECFAIKDALSKPADLAKRSNAIAKVLAGIKENISLIFGVGDDNKGFTFENEAKVEEFECPEGGEELFEALKRCYAAGVLVGILGQSDGRTISYAKIEQYNAYKKDLEDLKGLVKDHLGMAVYDEIFKGERSKSDGYYLPKNAGLYTKYNLGDQHCSYDDFIKGLKKKLEPLSDKDDARIHYVNKRIEQDVFLRRLRTSDNGSIPYQLHLEELQNIIKKQACHHPFLAEPDMLEKISSLVSFRIPYYVGPLTQKNAAKDKDGKNRFTWSVRRPGKEQERIYPWNWEEVIDKDKSAQAFMERMIGMCTYLCDEPVLPRHSLVYELFCVLNELNGARVTQDGDRSYRLSKEERLGIIEDLFKKRKTVTYKAVENWLEKHRGSSVGGAYKISGGQGEDRFESKLEAYNDFKKILELEEISGASWDLVETCVLWCTLFEDRDILKQKLKAEFSDCLSPEQIQKISKRRYMGWGRLSKRLLCDLCVEHNGNRLSIMDVLKQGNPFPGRACGQPMTFMELISDNELGFGALIEDCKKEQQKDLDIEDIIGSPALRRACNQVLRIVDEISSLAGKAPSAIFVEVARDEDLAAKGKRTEDRSKHIKRLYSTLGKNKDLALILKGLTEELNTCSADNLAQERLYLYFLQMGKCLYSGKALDIANLSSYQVDHILPQAYIKDDSIENKALVLPVENQRKKDSLLLESSVIRRQMPYWKQLFDVGLIGKKKFFNLTRRDISDAQLKGFINRQLVETRQITKQVQQLLVAQYPETKVLSVKASFTHEIRKSQGFVKCREVNDYHHAHDAYLACQVGRFIQSKHPDIYDNPIKTAAAMKAWAHKQALGGSFKGQKNFLAASFAREGGLCLETGELTWDAPREISKIRWALNCPDCFISLRPTERSGAFWDATLYSPHADKNGNKTLEIPFKKGLPVERYGGYSSRKFAYFFVFSGVDPKKGRRLVFAPVPVDVAQRLGSHKDALLEYAQKLAEQKGFSTNPGDVKIVRSKILCGQKIRIKGEAFYLRGYREMRNASQLAFSQEEIKCLLGVGDKGTTQDLVGLYQKICNFKGLGSKNPNAPRASKLITQLKLDRCRYTFVGLEPSEQRDVLLRIIKIIAGHCNMIDLSIFGESKNAGCMCPSFDKILNKEGGFEVIDSSVTGMLESSDHIGL